MGLCIRILFLFFYIGIKFGLNLVPTTKKYLFSFYGTKELLSRYKDGNLVHIYCALCSLYYINLEVPSNL